MPRGDGTGQMGMGPMTGRGVTYAAPGYANPMGFAGGPGGFGRGRGFRRMFYATGSPCRARFGYPAYAQANGEAAYEREFLNNQAEFLEKQLRQVKKSLSLLNEDGE